MKRQVKLEGSLIVEMLDGTHRMLTCSPFNGNVYHCDASTAFGIREETPEAEFRSNMRHVVSRSSYDKR